MSLQPSRGLDPESARHVRPSLNQLAALCWRPKQDGSGVEVLLVTSSTGRWILPKGWPMSGKSPAQAAMTEAWEEAGVSKGKVSRRALGSFIGLKRTLAGDDLPCQTKVYAVKVQKTSKDFPESNRRGLIWVNPRTAATMVTEDGLRDILLHLPFAPSEAKSAAGSDEVADPAAPAPGLTAAPRP